MSEIDDNSWSFDGHDANAMFIQGPGTATETIDLSGLFTTELTTSGSFDIRSDIWATTFGKVLQALPIPAVLLDRCFAITVLNQACARLSPKYAQIQSKPFCSLLPHDADAKRVRSIVEEVFSKRKPRVAEGLLSIDESRRWARMTFRSIRIMDQRFILVLFEDLTQQKKQLILSRKQEEELRRYREQLEQLVQDRTSELETLNQTLETEIDERRRVEEALRMLIGGMEDSIREERGRICRDVTNVTKPHLDQLKAERLPDSAKHLLECVEHDLREALSSFSYDFTQLPDILTPQELRVCELIRSSLNTKQIADVLCVTHETVSFHRTSIRKKLGLTGSDDDLALHLRKKI